MNRADPLVTDWSLYPNFPKWETDCRHTGTNRMRASTMARLQQLRELYGKPMPISSAFRHETHPEEARKAKPGVHNKGCAVDVKVYGGDVLLLMKLAVEVGFTGVGVSQKGPHGQRFIHLDDYEGDAETPRPWCWSY